MGMKCGDSGQGFHLRENLIPPMYLILKAEVETFVSQNPGAIAILDRVTPLLT